MLKCEDPKRCKKVAVEPGVNRTLGFGGLPLSRSDRDLHQLGGIRHGFNFLPEVGMLPFQHYHVFTELVEEFFGSLFLPDRLVFRPRLSHRTASHRDKLREGPKGTRHDVVCGFGRGMVGQSVAEATRIQDC
jgi:hypothetical protein